MELELVRLDGCELLGGGERARAVGVLGHGSSTLGDKAVEQVDPHGKRQLLAGNAVDQRLEDGRKAWWPESTHTLGERAEQRVRRGHCSELGEIDGQPEELVQCVAREYLRMPIDRPTGEADRQAWRAWRAILSHRQRDRPAVDGHRALIRGSVPAIEGVVGAATQCPRREVEPERRVRFDQEPATLSRLDMTRQLHATTAGC